jgi:hypothetical protein
MALSRVALLTLAAALAACSQDRGTTSAPAPAGEVSARFQPGGATDVIQVTANGRYALRSAELIAPDGSAVQAAYNIETEQMARYPGGGSGVLSSFGFGMAGGGGGGVGVGTGIGLTLPLGPGPQRQTWSGEIQSNAFIRIPDPVGYRQAWQGYRVRATLGEPPNDLHTVTLAAPAPPP